jgi:hypothetical protein
LIVEFCVWFLANHGEVLDVSISTLGFHPNCWQCSRKFEQFRFNGSTPFPSIFHFVLALLSSGCFCPLVDPSRPCSSLLFSSAPSVPQPIQSQSKYQSELERTQAELLSFSLSRLQCCVLSLSFFLSFFLSPSLSLPVGRVDSTDLPVSRSLFLSRQERSICSFLVGSFSFPLAFDAWARGRRARAKARAKRSGPRLRLCRSA